MGNFKLALTLLDPVAIGTSSEHPQHPASNVAIFELPQRTAWTATSTELEYWELDLGAIRDVGGLLIINANFALAGIEGADVGDDWVNYGVHALALDDRTLRWTLWWEAFGFTHRRLRVFPFNVQGDAAFFQAGSIVPTGPVEEMVNNWGGSYPHKVLEPATITPKFGGGNEVNDESLYRSLTYSLRGEPWLEEAMPQLRRLAAIRRGEAFVMFENRGNPAHAYLLKRMNEPEWDDEERIFTAPFELEECR